MLKMITDFPEEDRERLLTAVEKAVEFLRQDIDGNSLRFDVVADGKCKLLGFDAKGRLTTLESDLLEEEVRFIILTAEMSVS